MTTPGSGELYILAPSRSRAGGSVGKASWKMGCILFVLCATIATGQTFRTVARFDVPYVFPESPVVQGIDRNFYGTTAHSVVQNGPGQVYKVTPDGMLTTVNNSLGGSPTGALVQTADGDLYGTTFGTVFKLTPGGTVTTLLNFCFLDPNCTYGFEATGPLLQGNDGNFYGETGSPNVPCIGPCATIFKITPTGTLTTLVTFDTDAHITLSFQGNDGNFYGTFRGLFAGVGSVFKLTPSGTFTTLYSFCSQPNCADGGVPTALVRAADGNFYGTNSGGGAFEGGTVFKLTPGGTLTTLYSFCAQDPTICIDGAGPQGLIQGTDGNFYGTTFSGGANGHGLGMPVGTVFKITPGGTLTTLHSFCARTNCTDGIAPVGLIQATSGTFYGGTDLTSSTTGNSIGGTIFSLCVGLGWFTEELPNFGKVGDTIDILGTDLTGASSVTFNGITAPFSVVSPTLIRATVPPGATTGYVRVTLPSGRIPSNQKFRVSP